MWKQDGEDLHKYKTAILKQNRRRYCNENLAVWRADIYFLVSLLPRNLFGVEPGTNGPYSRATKVLIRLRESIVWFGHSLRYALTESATTVEYISQTEPVKIKLCANAG